uniref:Uncharacterized protein n=1 Tax=Arundo donax TaxID=35708 RepID=A0A0A9HAB0_ARUDO
MKVDVKFLWLRSSSSSSQVCSVTIEHFHCLFHFPSNACTLNGQLLFKHLTSYIFVVDLTTTKDHLTERDHNFTASVTLSLLEYMAPWATLFLWNSHGSLYPSVTIDLKNQHCSTLQGLEHQPLCPKNPHQGLQPSHCLSLSISSTMCSKCSPFISHTRRFHGGHILLSHVFICSIHHILFIHINTGRGTFFLHRNLPSI